jgi:ATP-dependent RNA helicase DDX54/DBP10
MWGCVAVLQVREIVGRLRESRQTLMFSATLPRSLADFAAAGLSSPQLVRLDADRKLSPDLGLAFFTGVGSGCMV